MFLRKRFTDFVYKSVEFVVRWIPILRERDSVILHLVFEPREEAETKGDFIDLR